MGLACSARPADAVDKGPPPRTIRWPRDRDSEHGYVDPLAGAPPGV